MPDATHAGSHRPRWGVSLSVSLALSHSDHAHCPLPRGARPPRPPRRVVSYLSGAVRLSQAMGWQCGTLTLPASPVPSDGRVWLHDPCRLSQRHGGVGVSPLAGTSLCGLCHAIGLCVSGCSAPRAPRNHWAVRPLPNCDLNIAIPACWNLRHHAMIDVCSRLRSAVTRVHRARGSSDIGLAPRKSQVPASSGNDSRGALSALRLG